MFDTSSGQSSPEPSARGDRCLLEAAISESVIAYDSNGNPSLQKGRQKGRIDALQAAVLAVGLGSRRLEAERSSPMFEFDSVPLSAM